MADRKPPKKKKHQKTKTNNVSRIGELQRLSLVSKVCTELDNHLGLSDRTLAEFIIHLADEFPDPPAFRHALSQNGAEFPDSLSDNLLRIIGAMNKSSAQGEANKSGGGGGGAVRTAAPRVPRNEQEARFPGLAMPNTKVVDLEEGFGEVSEAKRDAKAASDEQEATSKTQSAAARESRERSSNNDASINTKPREEREDEGANERTNKNTGRDRGGNERKSSRDERRQGDESLLGRRKRSRSRSDDRSGRRRSSRVGGDDDDGDESGKRGRGRSADRYFERDDDAARLGRNNRGRCRGEWGSDRRDKDSSDSRDRNTRNGDHNGKDNRGGVRGAGVSAEGGRRLSRWGDDDGGDNGRQGCARGGGPGWQPQQPELYGIYDGSVSKVMDFGCFVELRGFPPLPNGKRPEGLVHVSQIQNGMLRDPSKAVKRGQPCKVKVISSVRLWYSYELVQSGKSPDSPDGFPRPIGDHLSEVMFLCYFSC